MGVFLFGFYSGFFSVNILSPIYQISEMQIINYSLDMKLLILTQ